MAKQGAVSQLVVIGASSGGIDALSTLLSSLPAGLPTALVIAQHLSPSRASHLEEILARRTPLAVQTVTERTPLQTGTVYVVPPNRHVEVTNHELRLIPDQGGPHPSVDLLLSSAARAFGESVVAVILSGQGSDGAMGAREVKAAGGVVIIQDPATAAYPSMPRALAPTTVDVAAPVEQIGALLEALLTGHDRPRALEDGPDLPSFLEHIRKRQGLDFSGYRTPTIQRRLHRRLVATGTKSLNEYRQYLDAHPEEYQRLVQAFLIEVAQAASEEVETLNEELQDVARRAELERARLEAVLVGLSDAVLIVDTSGRTTLANATYEQLFGDPGRPISAVDAEGNPVPPEQLPAARAAAGETFSMEFATQSAEGGRRWFEARGQPVSSDGHHQAVVVVRDVTERSLRRLQEEFLSLAGHELSTPLTVIRGYLQLLLRALERDPGRVREYAGLALSQVEQLTTIARDLMDVARVQRGQLRVETQPVDLPALARRVVDQAKLLGGEQQIRVAVPEAPLLVCGDEGRLQQVLLNLLTNAIRYAPESDHIDVRLMRRNDRAELQVQDYGPGIPAEQQQAVFSRFFQGAKADRTGLGLGLYLAREIVTAHGGTIRVDSKVGEGTTFTVSLPLLMK